MCNHYATDAGSIVEEGEVDSNIEGRLCCNAGCNEIQAEAGVCTQHVEKQGLFGGGLVACQWVEGQGISLFGRLRCTG